MIDPYNHINDFLNGKLTADEHSNFLKALSSDKDLAKAVENHDVAMGIIESIIENETREVISEAQNKNKSNKPKLDSVSTDTKTKTRWLLILKYAAVACFIGWVGYWWMGTSQLQKPSFAEMYSEAPWPTERGNSNDKISELFSQYFFENKTVLKNTLQKQNSDQANYWLSELYIDEEKFDSTLLYLPQNIENDIIKRDRINYIKVLSLYFSGDYQKAQKTISELPKNTDKYYTAIYNDLVFID